MTDTPIGDDAAAAAGVTDPTTSPAPTLAAPADGSSSPAPADPPAEPAPASSEPAAPYLVRSLPDDNSPVRYGVAVGSRQVSYQIPGPVQPDGSRPAQTVDYTELDVAWFDGHNGRVSVETIERVEFATEAAQD